MELERVAWVAFLVGCCIALLLIDDGYDRMDTVGGGASETFSIPIWIKDGEPSGVNKNRRNGMNKSCYCYGHFFLGDVLGAIDLAVLYIYPFLRGGGAPL
jgi:hypothetical protein